jgi:hypothetical protein
MSYSLSDRHRGASVLSASVRRCFVVSLLHSFDLSQRTAAQLLLSAIQRYPARIDFIIPGIFASHTNGRAHQISRDSITAASAPPLGTPSGSKKRISRSNSASDNPSNAGTRGSCSGATPNPRLARMGASHRAIRVQNPQSASKNNHPRACRPFPSVNSDAREIMVFFPVSQLSDLVGNSKDSSP